jgi:O-antigen/teichoic acid export membrane protein
MTSIEGEASAPTHQVTVDDAQPTTRQRAGLAGLARGGALSLGGSAVSAVSGILVVLVLTRALPQEVAGTFFALTSVFLIAATAARLGTGTGLVYAISRTRALGEPGRAGACLHVALTPVVAMSVGVAMALFLCADGLAGLAGGSSGTADAVRVLAVLLPLTTVADSLVAATRGHGTILPTVVLDRVARPVLQLGGVAVAAATGSVVAVTAAWALPWVVSALLGGWWLLRLLPRADESPDDGVRPVARRPWREFWSFTAPRAVTSVVQLALQRLDIVLLTVLAGPAEAAVYTAATRFLVVGQVANQALASVVEPQLGRLLAVADRPAATAVYRTATGWLVMICWPLYLLVATYAESMLRVFGAGYDAGITVVFVLVGTMLVASAVGVVDVVLLMGGRSSWNLGNSMTALVLNVVVDLVLIPPLGLLGAAIGWAVAILANNLLPLAQVWRSMGMHPFGVGTGTAAALALACFGLPPLITRLLWDGGPVSALGATVVGVVLFAAGCRRWRARLAIDTFRALRRRRSSMSSTAPLDRPGPVR